MAEAAADGFISAKTRRRAPRGGRNKEMVAGKKFEGGRGGRTGRRMEMNMQQPVWQGLGRRPNAEWDHRSFSIIVAKADEKAIGVGVEKIISERRLVASYNWDIDSWIPTIVVPGAPKMFNPWPGGLLESRNQVMTIDEESFRVPNAPMEPLFTAVRICQPNFKLGDVDLVADLNCLKKLLRFVLHAAFPEDLVGGEEQLVNKMVDIKDNLFAGSNNDCDFRIDCQVLGNTVVMMRRETEHRGRAMGYGVGYLNACTELYDGDLAASGPHKRVTYVKFGSLRLLLRHKTLAAIYPKTGETGSQQMPNKRVAPTSGCSGDSVLSPSSLGCSIVRYTRGGYLGDHTELSQIEFASVSKERKSHLVIDKWLDMLFIGSSHLYFGQHVRGRFEQPTMRSRGDAWDLSGLKPSDGRRILLILETVLEKIIEYGRRSVVRDRRKDRGDGNDQQFPGANDPVSFAVISEEECRKLAVYKIGQSKKNVKYGKQRSYATPPTFLSESMMASLLACDQTH